MTITIDGTRSGRQPPPSAAPALAPLLFRDVDADVEKVADLHKKNA